MHEYYNSLLGLAGERIAITEVFTFSLLYSCISTAAHTHVVLPQKANATVSLRIAVEIKYTKGLGGSNILVKFTWGGGGGGGKNRG